jgi:RNA polymerase sigma factor (sigma-70 family)
VATAPVRTFEDEWPPLAARLATFLSHKGVAPCNIDDVVQETAVRLWSIRDRFDPRRPLWPLVVTIALNLLRDEARRSGRELCGVIPEISSEDDVERSALARVQLRQVEESLAQLTPQRRNALLAELGYQRTWGPHVRANKMVRMRARRALRELLEKKSLGWVVALRLRKLSTMLQHAVGPQGLGAAGDNLAASLGALAALGLLTLPTTADATTSHPTGDSALGSYAALWQDDARAYALAAGGLEDQREAARQPRRLGDDDVPPGAPGHGISQPVGLPIEPPDTSDMVKVTITPPAVDPEDPPREVPSVSPEEDSRARRLIQRAMTAARVLRSLSDGLR